MSDGSRQIPAWFSEHERSWVEAHGAALDSLTAELLAGGTWPDPVALERRLRAEGRQAGILAAVRSMPRTLGWRQGHDPSEVVLTPALLLCVPAAAPLLEAYLGAFHAALQRFDDHDVPARLTRAELEEQLQQTGTGMDVLSLLLLGPGNVMFAGGAATMETWDMRIDERVVQYAGAGSAEELIEQRARELSPKPQVTSDAGLGGDSAGAQPSTRTVDWNGGTIALAIVGVVANLAALFATPPMVWVGTFSASLAALLLPRRWWPVRGIIAILLVGAVAAGVTHLAVGSSSAAETVDQQLDGVLRDAGRHGAHAVFRGRARFHGSTGPPSQILVLRDDNSRRAPGGDVRVDTAGHPVSPGSDELRIYDVVAGRLKLAFDFQPQRAGVISQAPEGDSPSFTFKVRSTGIVDGGSGRHALVGAFARDTLASGPLPMPVIVMWRDVQQSYALFPLVPSSANRRFVTVLRDKATGDTVHGGAADQWGLRTGSTPAVVAGYEDHDPFLPAYSVKAWFLDLQTDEARLVACGQAMEGVQLPDGDGAQHVFATVADEAGGPCKR